jgi:hypothetical protein
MVHKRLHKCRPRSRGASAAPDSRPECFASGRFGLTEKPVTSKGDTLEVAPSPGQVGIRVACAPHATNDGRPTLGEVLAELPTAPERAGRKFAVNLPWPPLSVSRSVGDRRRHATAPAPTVEQ